MTDFYVIMDVSAVCSFDFIVLSQFFSTDATINAIDKGFFKNPIHFKLYFSNN